MKRLMYKCSMLAVVLLLTACSAGNSSTKQETRSFTAENGTIEVPENPERIVAISFLGDLLALGVTPVGAGSLALENSVLLEEELKDVANVGDIDIEKVLELEPDLIIIPSYFQSDVIEQLSKIAPTVAIAWGGFANTDPLEEVRTFGELLNREQEAEEFISRYQKKAKEAKEEIAAYLPENETVGSYSIWAKNFWVYPKSRDASYNLYEAFGYQAPQKIQTDVLDSGSTGLDISLELIDEYASDHMFVSVYTPDGGEERSMEVFQSDIWKNLPAVKNNHVYLLDYKKFWMTDGLNLERQLPILVETIKAQNAS